MPIDREKLGEIMLYAYLGEDELGSGEIGIKQGLVPAGMIPLVSIDRSKLEQPYIIDGLQAQADRYGKTIVLVSFTSVNIFRTIEPK
jgi:hypothetical protein